MFRFQIYVCWQTKNKNMSRLGVRHCSSLFKSRFKTSQATEKEFRICKARPIERKTRPI